jgi:hypothetical protein
MRIYAQNQCSCMHIKVSHSKLVFLYFANCFPSWGNWILEQDKLASTLPSGRLMERPTDYLTPSFHHASFNSAV